MAYANCVCDDLYEEPKGETEKEIGLLWREMTGAGQVSRNDTFFDAGGTSMQLLAVNPILHARFGSELPLTTYFIHTLSQIAALIEAKPLSAGQKTEPVLENSKTYF